MRAGTVIKSYAEQCCFAQQSIKCTERTQVTAPAVLYHEQVKQENPDQGKKPDAAAINDFPMRHAYGADPLEGRNAGGGGQGQGQPQNPVTGLAREAQAAFDAQL